MQVVAAGGSHKLPARPKTPVFIAAQKYVRAKLDKRWLAAFITSPQYLGRHKSAEAVCGGGHTHHDSQPASGIRVLRRREGGGGGRKGEEVEGRGGGGRKGEEGEGRGGDGREGRRWKGGEEMEGRGGDGRVGRGVCSRPYSPNNEM